MKKNIDHVTAALFVAAKNEYLRNFTALLEPSSGSPSTITVDQVAALVAGKRVDGVRLNEPVDKCIVTIGSCACEFFTSTLGSCVRLAEDYTCSVAALPRIYKELAKMAGEKPELITVGTRPALPFGLTEPAIRDRANKNIIKIFNKFSKQKNWQDFAHYVFHDPARRCAVWTNSFLMVVSSDLYNADSAGYMYDCNGQRYPSPVYVGGVASGTHYRYPNYAAVVDEITNCSSLDANTLRATLARVRAVAKTKGSKVYPVHFAEFAGEHIGINIDFAEVVNAMGSRVYVTRPDGPIISPIGAGINEGFIIAMPLAIEEGEDSREPNVIFFNKKTADKVYGSIPVAVPDALPPVLPPLVQPAAPASAPALVQELPASTVGGDGEKTATTSSQPAPASAPALYFRITPPNQKYLSPNQKY